MFYLLFLSIVQTFIIMLVGFFCVVSFLDKVINRNKELKGNKKVITGLFWLLITFISIFILSQGYINNMREREILRGNYELKIKEVKEGNQIIESDTIVIYKNNILNNIF